MWHRLLQRHLHTHAYCSTTHNSQVMETAKMPPVLMNGLRKCGIYTQWNTTRPWRRMKSYHSQVNEWNWRTSSWARLARLTRPKIICSPSYADFRSRANTAMLLDLGHMIKGEHTGGMGIGKKPKTWKCLMSPLQRNLKATEVNMRRGSGTREKVN
jgi:hypothetical protein